MNHTFRSRRESILYLEKARGTLIDAVQISSLSEKDVSFILSRRESSISDEKGREASERRSLNLGSLLEEAHKTIQDAGLNSSLPKSYPAWDEYVKSGKRVDFSFLNNEIQKVESSLNSMKIEEGEEGGFSSYSDYSDSRSSSSSSSSEEESSEGEEESESCSTSDTAAC